MEEADRKTLDSLQRLALIQQGQRIATSTKRFNGEIFIEDDEGIIQWVKRVFYTESRGANIAAVKEKFIEAEGIIQRAMEREQQFQTLSVVHSNVGGPLSSLNSNLKRMENMQMMIRTRNLMENALAGFGNLIPTYKNKHDQNIESDIIGVQKKVKDQLMRADAIIATIQESLEAEWKHVFSQIMENPDVLPQPVLLQKNFLANFETSPAPAMLLPETPPPTVITGVPIQKKTLPQNNNSSNSLETRSIYSSPMQQVQSAENFGNRFPPYIGHNGTNNYEKRGGKAAQQPKNLEDDHEPETSYFHENFGNSEPGNINNNLKEQQKEEEPGLSDQNNNIQNNITATETIFDLELDPKTFIDGPQNALSVVQELDSTTEVGKNNHFYNNNQKKKKK